MSETKLVKADYVVQYVGYSGYVIGKCGASATVCAVIDFWNKNIIISFDDGGADLNKAISAGQRVGERTLSWRMLGFPAAYRMAKSGGPVALDVHGLGLFTHKRMTFKACDQSFDGRYFRTKWPVERLLNPGKKRRRTYEQERFLFDPEVFDGKTLLAWQPDVALGRECLALEYWRMAGD
jgi:hypothetical protein